MKKVLALCRGAYIGGVEVITLDILEGLRGRGCQIFCIINGWNDGDFPERLQKLGIPYQPVKLGWFYLKKLRWTLHTLLHLPRALWMIYRILTTFDHDLIYVTSYRFLLFLTWRHHKPIIFHVHDTLSKDRQFLYLQRYLDAKIHKYIAVSDAIRDDLEKLGINRQKIERIYNGVSIDFAHDEVFMKEESEVVNIGIVGQVIPRKGHGSAIEAFRLISDKIPSTKLHIVGKGDEDYIKVLKEKIGSYGLEAKIIWRGYKSNKIEIYQGIDILIVPSVSSEPFGLIAAEANAYNIPVIATKVGGLTEIIKHGYNGLLVDPGDIKGLANALLYLIENKVQRITMGKNGKSKMDTMFSLQSTINAMYSLVNELP